MLRRIVANQRQISFRSADSDDNSAVRYVNTDVLRPLYRPHADIVMSLEDTFAYISPETGWIWTKLGKGINGEGIVLYRIFGEIAPGVPEKEAKTKFFS